MKTLITAVLLALMAALCSFAQISPTLPPPDPPGGNLMLNNAQQVLLFVGGGWDNNAKKATTRVGGLYPLGETTAIGVTANFTPLKSDKLFSAVTFEGVKQIGKVNSIPIFAILDGGPAWTPSDPTPALKQVGKVATAVISNLGTNVGYLAMTGVGARIMLGKDFCILPSFRVSKGSLNDTGWQMQISFGRTVTVAKTP